MVCTTVTNTLVQNAISTLPARADGAAAGSGQQGRSSSEGRGAVVQDAEGSKQQRAGRTWLKRLPRHASLEPSSDRTWAPGIPPLLWTHVPSLGVAPVASEGRCEGEVCARDADGLIGRAGRCWGRGFSARPAGDSSLRAAVELPASRSARDGRLCP